MKEECVHAKAHVGLHSCRTIVATPVTLQITPLALNMFVWAYVHEYALEFVGQSI